MKNSFNSGWLWAFIVPALISFVFFAILAFDSFQRIPDRTNADKLTAEVVAGKRAFQKYNCNDCHTFFGIGGYYAPDLTKVYKKYGDNGRELLKNIIINPEDYFGKESGSIFDFNRRMQKPHTKHFADGKIVKKFITEDEAERIIDYLKWVSEIDNNDWPPAYSKKYNKVGDGSGSPMSLLESKNCLMCHKYEGQGNEIGPEFDKANIRKRFKNMGDLKKFIIGPPESSDMPPYGNAEFTEEELNELVRFLWEGE